MDNDNGMETAFGVIFGHIARGMADEEKARIATEAKHKQEMKTLEKKVKDLERQLKPKAGSY